MIEKIKELANADIYVHLSKHVELKKDGHNYSAICPFHQEKTPSFKVNVKHRYFKCFGCG